MKNTDILAGLQHPPVNLDGDGFIWMIGPDFMSSHQTLAAKSLQLRYFIAELVIVCFDNEPYDKKVFWIKAVSINS